MKKKLLTIFLAASLLVTMSFAGTSSVFADSTTSSVPEATEVQSGVQTTCYNTDVNAVKYYKIKSPSNGYLTVQLIDSISTEGTSYAILLKNYKGQNLYGTTGELIDSSDSNKAYIGVPKGTYYVGVKTLNSSYDIKITHTAIKEKSGKTRAKAISIYKGKYRSGIITAPQSKTSSDWYKIKITKKQKVSLRITTKTGAGKDYGGVQVTMYRKGTSSKYGTSSFVRKFPDATLNPYTYSASTGSQKYLAAGTYYFRIQKYQSGNGYYKIKWL